MSKITLLPEELSNRIAAGEVVERPASVVKELFENSVDAGATVITVEIERAGSRLIRITDNGSGMKEETLLSVSNPFYTTRTTRKVGMGIPLFRFAAEQTGGTLTITSRHIEDFPDCHGTTVKATFYKRHIDFTPLGDVSSTVITLIQGHPDVDFLYDHVFDERCVTLDTRELREVLGEVPLDTFEVIVWIKDNLKEQYEVFNKIK